MTNRELDLSKRLDLERDIKLRELININLEKLLTLNIHYSEICRESVGGIIKLYLGRYLTRFEHESLDVELGSLSEGPNKDNVRKIFEIFYSKDYELLDEKNAAINRLSSAFFNEYCNPNTGLIDWVKLIQFNSGNYKS